MSSAHQVRPTCDKTILIVKDQDPITTQIGDRLTRMGFRVLAIADSGEQAIRTAETAHPDVVLIDIALKGNVDASEAADYIHHVFAIPVVFLAGDLDPATVRRVKKHAIFGYVPRPFREWDLLVAIEAASVRHTLEQRLQESEQKYTAMLANIGDAVTLTDAHGCVTYMNSIAELLSGQTFAEAQGAAIEDVFPLVHDESRVPVDHPVRQALRQGTTALLTGPVLLVPRTNDEILVSGSATAITSDRGIITGTIVVFRDVRQLRFTEDALHRARQQLHRSQKVEAIGRLAGGVAHDFNNLLTVINGYCDLLLRKGQLDELSTTQVRQVLNAGERGARLTAQLLAFGRKQMLQPEIVDLNNVILQMGNLLQRLIGENISLHTTMDPALRRVSADVSQIEQIIMNLTINACDAMPAGGQLTIETGNVDFTETTVASRPEIRPGPYVMLSVSDTGTGFNEEIKANMFEPFFTTKELGKGSGMGLATVYGIVKQSDGFIYAYSEPGRGASFKIYLPTTNQEVLSIHKSAVSGELVKGGSETLLLVEDEEAVRELSATTLQNLGYRILQAGNGEEALQVCQDFNGRIDLLITDVIMPKLGGPQLVERLHDHRSGLPVLYLSGYSDDAVIRHGILRGEISFLQKPFAGVSLAAKVRQVLDSSMTRQASLF